MALRRLPAHLVGVLAACFIAGFVAGFLRARSPGSGDRLPDVASAAAASGAPSGAPARPFEDVWPPLARPLTGDLDAMLARQEVRVLTAFTLGAYYIDGGRQHGTVYEMCRILERSLRRRSGGRGGLLKVTILPVRRDQLLPYLVQGFGDVVFANLTDTPERRRLVDFSVPYVQDTRELLVQGPVSPVVQRLEDLAGHPVMVRRQSSYHESLLDLNRRLRAEGLRPIDIVPADPRLEDEDLLEMLQAGLIPMTVVDAHKLVLWSRVFRGIRVRDDIPIAEGRNVALAFRKDSPRLKALLDEFVLEHRVGSLVGNVLRKRHFGSTDWVKPALRREPFGRLEELVPLFRNHAQRYEFDWLLLASFAFQESGFDQAARSRAGAVGIMQVLPRTAAHVGIPDVSSVDANIHAGTRYLSLIRDRHFPDPDLDPIERTLFTMAAYNAGPARIKRLRRVAEQRGLDPDRWFGNVEHVVAAEVGQEPVRYVSNIYKVYVAYKLSAARLEARLRAGAPRGG